MHILDKIKEACENCINDAEKAIEEVTDGSEDIYEGRMEFANQVLSLIEEDSQEYRNISSYLGSYDT
jgi:hypothetical protein